MSSSDLNRLPENLPRLSDDGAAAHLEGSHLPSTALESTDGARVDLSTLIGMWVIYVYPMTSRPDVPSPEGWDGIPGARGCTPQSCGFRDHQKELLALGASVLGLSAQTSSEQCEAQERLHLPFELLRDASLRLKQALRLPTFRVGRLELFKRITLIVEGGRIRKVFYPVFPPDRNAAEVISWLHASA